MKTLREPCLPRKSVFDRSRRDDVLDLTDLLRNKMKGVTSSKRTLSPRA